MKRLLVVLALVPFAAGAAPVYLKCHKDGAKEGFDVTVDEALGRVVHSGYQPFEQARFTANEISYEHVDDGPIFTARETFSIERNTLAFKSVWAVGASADSSQAIVSTGKCERIKPEQRKP